MPSTLSTAPAVLPSFWLPPHAGATTERSNAPHTKYPSEALFMCPHSQIIASTSNQTPSDTPSGMGQGSVVYAVLERDGQAGNAHDGRIGEAHRARDAGSADHAGSRKSFPRLPAPGYAPAAWSTRCKGQAWVPVELGSSPSAGACRSRSRA